MKHKIKNIYLGHAIGDALVLATEFMSKTEIAKNYTGGIYNYNDIVSDDVMVAVIDEGGMLCGKSLFDKFRTWKFYENDRKLIVYK